MYDMNSSLSSESDDERIPIIQDKKIGYERSVDEKLFVT